MPSSVCGHAHSNSLTIPTVGVFPLNVEDVEVTREGGPQEIKVKTGTLVDTVNSVRVKMMITLYYVERTIYESIKTFAANDIQNYLSTFSGSVDVDLGGESITGAVIKSVQPGGSVIEDNDPEVEYLNTVELEVFANSFNWI